MWPVRDVFCLLMFFFFSLNSSQEPAEQESGWCQSKPLLLCCCPLSVPRSHWSPAGLTGPSPSGVSQLFGSDPQSFDVSDLLEPQLWADVTHSGIPQLARALHLQRNYCLLLIKFGWMFWSVLGH